MAPTPSDTATKTDGDSNEQTRQSAGTGAEMKATMDVIEAKSESPSRESDERARREAFELNFKLKGPRREARHQERSRILRDPNTPTKEFIRLAKVMREERRLEQMDWIREMEEELDESEGKESSNATTDIFEFNIRREGPRWERRFLERMKLSLDPKASKADKDRLRLVEHQELMAKIAELENDPKDQGGPLTRRELFEVNPHMEGPRWERRGLERVRMLGDPNVSYEEKALIQKVIMDEYDAEEEMRAEEKRAEEKRAEEKRKKDARRFSGYNHQPCTSSELGSCQLARKRKERTADAISSERQETSCSSILLNGCGPPKMDMAVCYRPRKIQKFVAPPKRRA